MSSPSDRAATQAESRALRAFLRRFRRHADFLASPDAEALAARLTRLLSPVQTVSTGVPPPATRVGEPLRVVHWNILHGIEHAAVLAALRDVPELAGADLVSLNEVDVGMARSGNGHVAFDLAAALGMNAAWAAQFLELEAGHGAGRIATQDTGESLFGLALLSRWPLSEVRRVELPSPMELLFDRERKAGRYAALVARVEHPRTPFHAAVTHLDVHTSPVDRARQMRAVMTAVPPGPALLAGDLNTTTFARGTVSRSITTLATLAFAPRRRLQARLLAPQRTALEPLFDVLAENGFAIEPFNDEQESLLLRFAEVHELDAFPAGLRQLAVAALRWVERRNALRLDWIAARGFEPAPPGPFTLARLLRVPSPASDHAPIGCALRLAAS